MSSLEALKKGYKIRLKTWYWGKYIVRNANGRGYVDEQGRHYSPKYIPQSNWEIYKEEEHGQKQETR